jgi:DNA-binding LacI/PurR family transcriptional regulator
MAKPRKPVTLEDVARASGYSRATVSRVVNAQSSVDPAISKAVRAAIRRTGYSVNTAARTLAGGASRNVGLVFAEGFRELFQNPYWGEIVEGLSLELAEHGYRETFLVRDQQHRLDDYLAQRTLDAVVIMSPEPGDGLEVRLNRLGIPTVVFGQPSRPARTASVMIDEEECGALAARHFLLLKRLRPVVISGRSDMQVSQRRVDGFTAACTAAGIPVAAERIADGDFTAAGGYRAMHALLAKGIEIDAVFACSDRMALGALQALHEQAREVPDQVAVVGVDGTVLGEQSQPRLTSVGADLERLGHALGALTLEAIQGTKARTQIFEPLLVRRETA